MNKLPLFCLLLWISVIKAQQERLPADLRQHNLTTFNASLFNPAFSVDRNNPPSIALWSRWQWQSIDADPSTLFLNYTASLNQKSAVGAGFFQHNTGIFFNTGAVANYAYNFAFSPSVSLAVGANIFGFIQKLADDRFQVNPEFPLPGSTTETNDFILQLAPGASLRVGRLTFGLASENLIDYNFTAKQANTSQNDKLFMSLLSYDFPLTNLKATNAFLRPSVYVRTLPGQSNQVGFNTLFNTDTYYAQVGYSNLYGYALGGGVTFFKRMTLGANVEIGTSSALQRETSFEISASYFLGNPNQRHSAVGSNRDTNVLIDKEIVDHSAKTDNIDKIQSQADQKKNRSQRKAARKLTKQKKKEAAKEITAQLKKQANKEKETADAVVTSKEKEMLEKSDLAKKEALRRERAEARKLANEVKARKASAEKLRLQKQKEVEAKKAAQKSERLKAEKEAAEALERKAKAKKASEEKQRIQKKNEAVAQQRQQDLIEEKQRLAEKKQTSKAKVSPQENASEEGVIRRKYNPRRDGCRTKGEVSKRENATKR